MKAYFIPSILQRRFISSRVIFLNLLVTSLCTYSPITTYPFPSRNLGTSSPPHITHKHAHLPHLLSSPADNRPGISNLVVITTHASQSRTI
jgi:hypothetical protein